MRRSLRLRGVVESRGWANAGRFLASRLARSQDDLVFAADPAQLARPFTRAGLRMLVLTNRNMEWALPQPVCERMFEGEGALYREAVRAGDLGFIVLGPTDQLLHQSFVHFRVRTKQLIGESDAVPLIAYCRTAWAWRGHGLFSDTLGHIMAVLAVRGYRRALVSCTAANEVAIRSIEHLGFRRIRRLQSFILLNRWVWQRRSERSGEQRQGFISL
jgi:GNAT superfamily N-acetyltransferase